MNLGYWNWLSYGSSGSAPAKPSDCGCTTTGQVCTDKRCTWGLSMPVTSHVAGVTWMDCESLCKASPSTSNSWTYIDANCPSYVKRCYTGRFDPGTEPQITGRSSGTYYAATTVPQSTSWQNGLNLGYSWLSYGSSGSKPSDCGCTTTGQECTDARCSWGLYMPSLRHVCGVT